MTTVAIILNRAPVNERLVEMAGQFAASRCDDLLLVGVPDMPPWIQFFGPAAPGPFCVSTAFGELQEEVECELRQCIARVPVSVAATYVSFRGWTDPKLTQLLRLADSPTVFAALAGPVSRDRRKLEAIVRKLEGAALVITPSLPVDRQRESSQNVVGSSSW
jgi:hypothetical protein